MKKGIKRDKVVTVILFIGIITMLIIPLITAGFFEKVRGAITGKFTDTVDLNITVGGPLIPFVFNDTMTDVSTALNVGPTRTDVIINVTITLGAGIEDINYTSVAINFTTATEVRTSHTCTDYQEGATEVNFTCNISMFWFDSNGGWTITAYAKDNQSNAVQNITTNFSVGLTTGMELGPSPLTWASLTPGAENSTSTNDPLVLNNTGNKEITQNNTQINATDLMGEVTTTIGIRAGNMSVGYKTGSDIECGAASANELSTALYTNITTANLTIGNFSLNNGNTGQEQYYFCIKLVGSELTSQSYSTALQGSWTILVI